MLFYDSLCILSVLLLVFSVAIWFQIYSDCLEALLDVAYECSSIQCGLNSNLLQ